LSTTNLIVAGVGGQGVILATEILGNAAIKENFDVVISEIHGMAQRGGAVVSHARIGRKVYSPTVLEGSADAILGFEPVEVLRSLRYASDRTRIVTSKRCIIPPSVSMGIAEYPSLEQTVETYRRFTQHITLIDALRLAEQAGSARTQNIVLVGALAATGVLPFKNDTLKTCIQERVPRKYLEANLKAFDLGYAEASC
jgi:indolepyruvate ferredoxin oxidoreductase beta subunit